MCQIRDKSTNAAGRAAGGELLGAALQRNPVIGPAAVLVGSLLSLFLRRGQPAPVRETQPEPHRLPPTTSVGAVDPEPRPPAPAVDAKTARGQNEGRTKADTTRARWRPPAPGRSPSARSAGKGGRYHG